MVLWSVGFLLVAIYYLDIAIYDWRESKSFWNGVWVVIFFHAVVVSLKDIYLGKAPELVLLFMWGIRMKASDFIVHLQQMIEEHGDLPLALMEFSMNAQSYTFIEVDGVDSVIELKPNEVLLDSNDELTIERKVFLID